MIGFLAGTYNSCVSLVTGLLGEEKGMAGKNQRPQPKLSPPEYAAVAFCACAMIIWPLTWAIMCATSTLLLCRHCYSSIKCASSREIPGPGTRGTRGTGATGGSRDHTFAFWVRFFFLLWNHKIGLGLSLFLCLSASLKS